MPNDYELVRNARKDKSVIQSPMTKDKPKPGTPHDIMNYPPLRDYMRPSPQGEPGKVLGERSDPEVKT